MLRERGRSAADVEGLLASTLGLCAPDEAVTAAELIPRFRLDALPRVPVTLDPVAL